MLGDSKTKSEFHPISDKIENLQNVRRVNRLKQVLGLDSSSNSFRRMPDEVLLFLRNFKDELLAVLLLLLDFKLTSSDINNMPLNSSHVHCEIIYIWQTVLLSCSIKHRISFSDSLMDHSIPENFLFDLILSISSISGFALQLTRPDGCLSCDGPCDFFCSSESSEPSINFWVEFLFDATNGLLISGMWTHTE